MNVRARVAPATSIRRARRQEHVYASLWFVPLCCAVGAFALSRLLLAFDERWGTREPPHLILPGDATALAAVAATVAAAMLTFLGVVFSTTFVAVQLASGQYSPRIVRVFVRSRLTHLTLAVFLATFVFALNSLVAIREQVDPVVPVATVTIMYVLVIATVLMFIAFLHGMVRLLRVQYLLELTSKSSHAVLDQEFPRAAAYRESPVPPAPATRDVFFRDPTGVLQAVDRGALATVAAEHECWVDLLAGVGEHVGQFAPFARVHGVDADRFPDAALHNHVLIGAERTSLQDPALGIRLLVDVASRALSPAVNDPTTAVQALNRIVELLARIADRPDPTGWYCDEKGIARLHMRDPDFDRLAQLGLTEILRYGADAPQVTRRLAAAYDELEALVGDDRQALFATLRAEFRVAVDAAMPKAFLDLANVPDPAGLG